MLFIFTLLAASVLAAPVEVAPKVFKIPLKHHNKATSLKSLVDKGHARLNHFNTNGNGGFYGPPVSGPALNEDVTYVAPITIGGNTWQLIVDTGSSNTWCGARTACEPTSSGSSTGNSFGVGYGSGSVNGIEYNDKVQYGGAIVWYQSIGSATSSTGFSYVDGIIGFGPVGLTQGTVSNTGTVPTFMDNLYANSQIPSEVLGVYFAPEHGADSNDNNGELTLGGIDSSKYTGTLSYFPKVSSGPAAPWWGISITQYKYGAFVIGSGTGQAIVDTGTTLIYVPSSVYNYWLSMTGGSTDSASGLASWTTPPNAAFTIQFGSVQYDLTPSQYLVPTSQYAFYGLQPGKSYSWIYNGGTGTLNSIIGQKFLENYYSVYDTTNQRIGFATRA